MNIYGSLMDIYDEKKQRHFCRKKQKTFLSKHYFMRKPNPERGYLWTFKKNNS